MIDIQNKYIKNILMAGLLCLASLRPAISEDDFSKTGTTGFVFLSLPVTARYAGLGETGIAMGQANADGIFVNPALISQMETDNTFMASYGDWYLDTDHQAAAYVRRIPLVGNLGISLNMFNFGDMSRTRYYAPEEVALFSGSENNIYQELGTFSAGAFSLGLSYGRRMTDKFGFGATLKYVRENIAEYSVQNILADLGFIYDTGYKSVRIGAFLKNFGLETAYEDEKFKMPQQMTLGISFEPLGSLDDPTYVTVNIEAVHPNDLNEHVNVGVESRIANLIRLRAGYRFGYENENLSLGVGLHFVYKGKSVDADVSFMDHHYLGHVLRYTLMMEI